MARKTTSNKGNTGGVAIKPSPPLEPIVITPSEQFKAAVFEEIQTMEQARRDAHRVPEHILYRELERHLSAALNALYTEGRLSVGLTINDKYLKTIPKRSDNV